jgi:hypothetical protein
VLKLAVMAALLAASGDRDGLRFLEGEWIGEGAGQPGQTSGGGFSFRPELGGKILVRRNRAEYPATAERPAFVHEDLMVVYPDPTGKSARADYWDSEGHVIRYGVTSDGKSAVFLSEPDEKGMRYRLTYRSTGASRVSIVFELAARGAEFKPYISASARRK